MTRKSVVWTIPTYLRGKTGGYGTTIAIAKLRGVKGGGGE